MFLSDHLGLIVLSGPPHTPESAYDTSCDRDTRLPWIRASLNEAAILVLEPTFRAYCVESSLLSGRLEVSIEFVVWSLAIQPRARHFGFESQATVDPEFCFSPETKWCVYD